MWKIIDGSTNNCSPEPSRMVPRCKWRPINYHKCLIFSGFLMPLETGLWFFALKVPPSCHIHLDASRSHCRPDLSCRAMRDYYLWFWLPPPGNLCNLLVEIISNRPDLKVPKTGTSPMKKSLPKTGTIFVGWIDSNRFDPSIGVATPSRLSPISNRFVLQSWPCSFWLPENVAKRKPSSQKISSFNQKREVAEIWS